MTRFAQRRRKLARAVKKAGADAMLVTNFTQRHLLDRLHR